MKPWKHWGSDIFQKAIFSRNGERFLDFFGKWGKISRWRIFWWSYPQIINRLFTCLLTNLSTIVNCWMECGCDRTEQALRQNDATISSCYDKMIPSLWQNDTMVEIRALTALSGPLRRLLQTLNGIKMSQSCDNLSQSCDNLSSSCDKLSSLLIIQ